MKPHDSITTREIEFGPASRTLPALDLGLPTDDESPARWGQVIEFWFIYSLSCPSSIGSPVQKVVPRRRRWWRWRMVVSNALIGLPNLSVPGLRYHTFQSISWQGEPGYLLFRWVFHPFPIHLPEMPSEAVDFSYFPLQSTKWCALQSNLSPTSWWWCSNFIFFRGFFCLQERKSVLRLST